ncbi:MAG: glycosyltransferase family 39 protein [Candidatus Pacearchaeota archaeon]
MNIKFSLLTEKLRSKENKIIIVICIISFLLNVIGIWWGTPEGWHPDEVTVPTLQMAKEMDLKPNRFIHGSLHTYIVGLVLSPYYIKLKITNELSKTPTTRKLIGKSPYIDKLMTNSFIISRLISVIMGALIIFIVYLITSEVYNKNAALISSTLLAFTMSFVNFSHFATVDIPMTFWIILSMLFIIKLIKKQDMGYYLLSGLFIGFAISTKYTAGLMILLFFISHLLSKEKISLNSLINKQFSLGFSMIFIGFLIGTPFAIIDFSNFKKDVITAITDVQLYKGIRNPYPGYISHIVNLINGMGLALFLVSIIALTYTALKLIRIEDNSYKYTLLFFLFIVLFYLIVGKWNFAPMRFTVPLLPFIAILNGKFFYDMLKFKKKITIFVLVFIILYSFCYTISADILFINDSRYLATKWIERNIDKNSTIELYYYNPNIPENITVFQPKNKGFIEDFISGLESRKPDYIILSSLYYERYLIDINAFPERTKYFSDLINERKNYRIVAKFGRGIYNSGGSPGFGSIEKLDSVILRSLTLKPNPEFVNPTILILKRIEN